MLKNIIASRRGGAMIEHALLLCVLSLTFVLAVAYVGDQYRPQFAAWIAAPGIDQTQVGSIKVAQKNKDNETTKSYRIYQLPPSLQPH